MTREKMTRLANEIADLLEENDVTDTHEIQDVWDATRSLIRHPRDESARETSASQPAP